MKKQLILTLAALSLASAAKAQSLLSDEQRSMAIEQEQQALGEPVKNEILGATSRITSGQSTWITVYNMFGSIRDVGCVAAQHAIDFKGYYGPLFYKMRAEVKSGPNCGGATLFDDSLTFSGGGTMYIDGNDKAGFSLVKGVRSEQRPEEQNLGAQMNSTLTLANATKSPAWMTVYNTFGSIRDAICLMPGEVRQLGGYYTDIIGFDVRAEVMPVGSQNCSGPKVADVRRDLGLHYNQAALVQQGSTFGIQKGMGQ